MPSIKTSAQPCAGRYKGKKWNCDQYGRQFELDDKHHTEYEDDHAYYEDA